MPYHDLTISDLFHVLANLPKRAVAVETILNGILKPIAAAVTATHSSFLCAQWDALMKKLNAAYLLVNREAQSIANLEGQAGLLAKVFGGYAIPGTARIPELINEFEAGAEDIIRQTHDSKEVAIRYANDLITIAKAIVNAFPTLGNHGSGTTLNDMISDTEMIIKSLGNTPV
jgi:hypothetical protein